MTQPLKVIIGAGETNFPGWIAKQEHELDMLALKSWKRCFTPQSVDAMLAEHVFEHLTFEEGIIAAHNCFKYLKPGGYLRAAVPDKNFDNEWYQNLVQIGGPGPADHPAASHKIVYDYQLFQQVFETAGFCVNLLEYCDEKGTFHYKYWNPADGRIGRSLRFDTRNEQKAGALGMVSIILDAYKPLKIPVSSYNK